MQILEPFLAFSSIYLFILGFKVSPNLRYKKKKMKIQ